MVVLANCRSFGEFQEKSSQDYLPRIEGQISGAITFESAEYEETTMFKT